MNKKFTPGKIESLKPNEVFVFGSNLSGFHVGGAAKTAVKKFGAIYGQAEGLQGQSYAIPTNLPTVDTIRPHVAKFIKFAKNHPDLTFLVTPLGTGFSGFTSYEIAPLFNEALTLENIILPKSFVEVIMIQPRYAHFPLNSWDSNRDFLDIKEALEKSILPQWNQLSEIYVRTFLNTVQIVNSGFYLIESGKRVELPDDRKMIEGTAFYKEKFAVNNVPALESPTIIEVTEKDCLKEAVRLSEEGLNPAVLNMANRQHPGGGVLHGSRAQEESIFRRTSLFRSLYRFSPIADHFGLTQATDQYPLDQNFGGIYTPNAILFRDSEKNGCKLLEDPKYVSFITVAAMNRPRLTSAGMIDPILVEGVKNKMRTIFRIGLRHRHDSLVLGAWGCGAFCNPPVHVARLFHEVMEESEFKNKFRKIVFAIIEDHNSRKAHNPQGNLLPFVNEFSNHNF
ncbi:MAG: TIGR02452 family protein [Bacteroides sp.]|nr:TIGR02452 family protein [Bacteroides sp.]